MSISPLTTEKNSLLAKNKKYVFMIDNQSNKSKAVDEIIKRYNVKVLKSNVLNVKAKKRRLGKTIGKKKGFKKIIVTLDKSIEV
ncbi:MAG: 50S ribosomal protein L23 [Parcubacteria group bacterium GW2011_GWA2_31_28]|nr:MAG: 50S ribosomal protein L23 [Parcubacteria group bacterium GW2011_GWA2_31_28]